jgi:hypothetical protein
MSLTRRNQVDPISELLHPLGRGLHGQSGLPDPARPDKDD